VFPENYFVFRADRDYTDSKLTRGGGVLTAVHRSLSTCKRRYELELTYKCVWIVIPIPDGFNLLVGNHCFPPNMVNKVIENCFNSLENKLITQNFRVVLLGDFTVPGYDWVSDLPHAYTHYYTKLRGEGSITLHVSLEFHNTTLPHKVRICYILSLPISLFQIRVSTW
jgi:hypothetical protein